VTLALADTSEERREMFKKAVEADPNFEHAKGVLRKLTP